MQLGHYTEKDIINLKSNQLKTERKEISGTVLKSKSPPLVLGRVRQLCFVSLTFSSLVFLFPTINNRGRRLKARLDSKKWNIVVDVNGKQQMTKYLFFFTSFNLQVLTDKNAHKQKQPYRNIEAESSYLVWSLAKTEQPTSFPWWS